MNAAGHSLTVVDENNVPFAKGDIKLWFNGKFYEVSSMHAVRFTHLAYVKKSAARKIAAAPDLAPILATRRMVQQGVLAFHF